MTLSWLKEVYHLVGRGQKEGKEFSQKCNGAKKARSAYVHGGMLVMLEFNSKAK
jgi:hypothetical protein